MRKWWLLLALAPILQSCSSLRYSATTSQEHIKELRIVSVRDSSLVVLPGSYQEDLTTGMIQQQAKVLLKDSILSLKRFGSAGLFEAFFGAMFCGGIGLYFGGPAAVLGLIGGAAAGLSLASHEKEMRPLDENLDELKQTAMYKDEPEWLRQIH